MESSGNPEERVALLPNFIVVTRSRNHSAKCILQLSLFILQVYFFNLTNAPQFFAGEEKPKLQEVGPYVYL
jgi:hypothetical protein